MALSLTITFDAHDAPAQAVFWSELLGYERPGPPDGFATWEEFADARNIPEDQRDRFGAAEDPEGVGPRLLFLKVPESKSVKNRVHLDVHSGGEPTDTPEEKRAKVTAHVQRAVALGATERESVEEFGLFWTVMTDPEGNEFCIV